MSLQVWLPLTKDTRNQGLLNLPTPWDARTRDTGGKLGQYCYSDNAIYHIENEWLGNEWSLACWVKSSSWGQYNDIILCKNTTDSSNAQFYLSIIGGAWLNIGCNSGSETLKINYTFATNTWYHVAATYDGATLKLYLNGNEIGTKAYTSTQKTGMNNLGIGCRSTNAAGTSATGGSGKRMNDVRIYDHCLSPLEVKEISKGLILHYPLNDNSIQALDNCFINPRFDTNSGWNHWGRTGHQGSSGQSNDVNYCFRSGQAYVHWVSNAANATGEYLLYQSPSFTSNGGGIRSLQCICKEENSIKITDDVCFPAWNARNGGVPNSYWTSIESLGNGFYLCKCEGISQDGSNNLVGIYIKPGYKVYFSEVYLENYKSVCSDIFFSSTIIYDTSGYGNNGTPIGSFNVDNDTPKYKISTVFNGVDNCIQIGNWYILFQNPFTINVWFKKDEIGSKGYETLLGGGSGFEIDTRSGNSQTLSLYLTSTRGGTAYSPFNLSQWYMVTMVSDGTNEEFYVDGILRKTIEKKNIPNNMYRIGAWSSDTSQNFKGQMSDFRIYATALSAEDVKSLYNNSAYIDNQGNIYGAVYEEV